MNYYEAALEVLQSARRPLTIKEIVESALARRLIHPTGRTPEATMSALLYRRINADPQGKIEKLADPGTTRARRGSVRFGLRTRSAGKNG